jgi:hypothetical protein
MLKEHFKVQITLDCSKDGLVKFEPPEILDIIISDKYPTNDEIESWIIALGGNGAKVEKRYKLI